MRNRTRACLAPSVDEQARLALVRARELGMKTGVALKLDTPVLAIEAQLEELDCVLW